VTVDHFKITLRCVSKRHFPNGLLKFKVQSIHVVLKWQIN